jgi:hypothetical protein
MRRLRWPASKCRVRRFPTLRGCSGEGAYPRHRKRRTKTDLTLFVGLDRHEKTISVAMVEAAAGAAVRFDGTIANTWRWCGTFAGNCRRTGNSCTFNAHYDEPRFLLVAGNRRSAGFNLLLNHAFLLPTVSRRSMEIILPTCCSVLRQRRSGDGPPSRSRWRNNSPVPQAKSSRSTRSSVAASNKPNMTERRVWRSVSFGQSVPRAVSPCCCRQAS